MSRARARAAGPRARFPHRRSARELATRRVTPGWSRTATGARRWRCPRAARTTHRSPTSRARRRLGAIERLATPGGSGKTSPVPVDAARPGGLIAEPRVLGRGEVRRARGSSARRRPPRRAPQQRRVHEFARRRRLEAPSPAECLWPWARRPVHHEAAETWVMLRASRIIWCVKPHSLSYHAITLTSMRSTTLVSRDR